MGCGGIANSHLGGYQKNEVEVTAVTDMNPAAAKSFAEKAGPSAKCFADFKALLNSGAVDMVSICTPPNAHADAAVMALSKNIHVLCEKPLAGSIASARKIHESAQKSSAMIMTAFRHRYLPAMVKIKELLDADTIGTVVFFNNIFCGPSFAMKDKWFTKKAIAGGGCIFDTNSHSVDLFRFLMGEVIEQKAVMHRHFEGTDVEDAGTIIVKSKKGVLGSMTSAFVAGTGKAFIDIMGQKGEIFYDYCDPDKVKIKLINKQEWEIKTVEPSGGFTEQIAHFLGAINGKHKLSCTSFDGLRAVEIIQSTYN
ncbi:MAG: Gfo/Idh/MocA family oxidoreductase [Verrucomicrobia bacterium]|nr:Gfo/Idh/MocA family oxidoreductase [Verrucomicrobiota bacterium]